MESETAEPAAAADTGFRPQALLAARLLALLAASASLLWWMVLPGNRVATAPNIGSWLSWLVLLAAVRTLRNVPRRRVGAVVIAGMVLLGLVAMSAPPRTSNDSARYAWDGIVQKAGVSPYAFVPIDETLAAHRPAWLFAPGTAGPDGGTVCPPGLFGTESVAATGFPSGTPLCTAINRPYAPTIYPPMAEIYFLAVRAAVPDTVGYLAFQLAGLLIGVAVTAMLLAVLARAGQPLQLAAVWAWSPFVQLEAVNNAHIDVLAGALLLGAGMLLAAGRPFRSGAAFGAAVATKLIPLIAAPALLSRHPARFLAAAAGTFLLLYVPFLLAAGSGVLGFLPEYLREEGYGQAGGSRFSLARIVSSGPFPLLLSAAALAVVALVVFRTADSRTIWERQTLLIGLTLLIVSPHYPWYALLLLPFIVLSRRWEYVGVILALDFLYMVPSSAPHAAMVTRAALLAATLAVAGAAWLRRRARFVPGGTKTDWTKQ